MAGGKTHEYEGGVQVFVVFLDVVFVVFFRFTAIHVVELCAVTLLG